MPAAALDPAVSWHAVDEYRATADVQIGDVVHHVTIEVDDRGAVRSLWLPRWGNPDGGAFAEHPFGGELGGEATYEGYTIPTTLRGGVGIRHRRLAQRGLLPGRDRDRPVPLTARRALVTPPFCSRGGGPRSAREPASACWPRPPLILRLAT